MKNRLLLFIGFISFLGCSTYPETPEEVIEDLVSFLSSGECEKAMNLVTESAKEAIQGTIDAGCDPYEVTIDSINCEIEGDIAECDCYESRPTFGSFLIPYNLKVIGGKWKIANYTKDMRIDADNLDFGEE